MTVYCRTFNNAITAPISKSTNRVNITRAALPLWIRPPLCVSGQFSGGGWSHALDVDCCMHVAFRFAWTTRTFAYKSYRKYASLAAFSFQLIERYHPSLMQMIRIIPLLPVTMYDIRWILTRFFRLFSASPLRSRTVLYIDASVWVSAYATKLFREWNVELVFCRNQPSIYARTLLPLVSYYTIAGKRSPHFQRFMLWFVWLCFSTPTVEVADRFVFTRLHRKPVYQASPAHCAVAN